MELPGLYACHHAKRPCHCPKQHTNALRSGECGLKAAKNARKALFVQ